MGRITRLNASVAEFNISLGRRVVIRSNEKNTYRAKGKASTSCGSVKGELAKY
jgi:hypothetical protein